MELNTNRSLFEKEDTVVIAAVTEPLQFSEEVAKTQNIDVPIMYDPNHEVGSKYGVYNVPGGMDMGPVDTHSVFVIDKEGTIQWSEISIKDMYVPFDSIVKEVKKL